MTRTKFPMKSTPSPIGLAILEADKQREVADRIALDQAIKASLVHEEMKKHFRLMLDIIHATFSEDPTIMHHDELREFVAAANFATKSLGIRYNVQSVIDLLEGRLSD